MKLISAFFCLLLFPNLIFAQKDRLELNLTYEHLQPADEYEAWKTMALSYYRFPSKNFNYHFFVYGISREEKAMIFATGLTKDWSEKFYTRSGFSLGSRSEFTPQYRLDQDFNFKLLKKQNLVFTVGATYINYFNEHESIIFFGGPMYYYKRWNFVYNYHDVTNDPGKVRSYTHILSAGFGEDKKSWIYLTGSFGTQAYLATYLAEPENVDQKNYNFILNYRHWLTKKQGFWMEASYLKIEEGYEKYGISLGYFHSF